MIGFPKLGRPYGIFPPDECGTAALFDWPDADWPDATISPAMAALEILGDERTIAEIYHNS